MIHALSCCVSDELHNPDITLQDMLPLWHPQYQVNHPGYDEYIFDSTILNICQNTKPILGSLCFGYPQS